jgi:hypothetical protein
MFEQSYQGLSHIAITCNKLPVVSCQPQKSVQGTHHSWRWPRIRNFNFFRVHGDTLLGYDMAEIGYRGGTKSALGLLDEETVLTHYVRDHLDVLHMFYPSRTID